MKTINSHRSTTFPDRLPVKFGLPKAAHHFKLFWSSKGKSDEKKHCRQTTVCAK